jgi:hypothetical protein
MFGWIQVMHMQEQEEHKKREAAKPKVQTTDEKLDNLIASIDHTNYLLTNFITTLKERL